MFGTALITPSAEQLAKNASIIFGTCPNDATALDKPYTPVLFGTGETIEIDVLSYGDNTIERKADKKKFFIRTLQCRLKKDVTLFERKQDILGQNVFVPKELKSGANIGITVQGEEQAIKANVKNVVGGSFPLTTVAKESLTVLFQ